MIKTFVVWIMSLYSMSLISFLYCIRENIFNISKEGLIPFSTLFSHDNPIDESKSVNI